MFAARLPLRDYHFALLCRCMPPATDRVQALPPVVIGSAAVGTLWGSLSTVQTFVPFHPTYLSFHHHLRMQPVGQYVPRRASYRVNSPSLAVQDQCVLHHFSLIT